MNRPQDHLQCSIGNVDSEAYSNATEYQIRCPLCCRSLDLNGGEESSADDANN